MYTPMKKEIKEQILSRIKNEGVNAHKAATEAGISPKTVYGWLARDANQDSPSTLEFNRLKRENEGLYQIIGQLTSVLEKQKKGSWSR